MDAKLLIVGAGTAGRELAQEIFRLSAPPEVAGFVDDDSAKQGTQVEGLPVLGTVDDLSRLISEHQIDQVVVSAPSASGALVRRVIAACRTAKIRLRIVPRIAELIEGNVRWGQVSEVQPEDLLGRSVVRHDLEIVKGRFRDKTVLVTGAAGSIGSELSRQLVLLGANRLVCLDANENGMFLLGQELIDQTAGLQVAYEIGNVRDEGRMRRLFERHHPAVVFHAAAYKHVPLMEAYPSEAVLNNVLGTRNIAELALEYGADDFVMVSTDKAVNPTSVMGCTKRIAEKTVQTLATRQKTRFVAVRFGNVLGSAGSVIPVFKRQIANGGPVTVTHTDIIRFFMTIPEAAQLIIQSWNLGETGQIFVLDMGEPVKIFDLAEQMIRLHGLEPGRDIAIEFTGLRPGEKLYEETLTEQEKVQSTQHDKIFMAKEEEVFDAEQFAKAVDALIASALDGDDASIREQLPRLVPTYQPVEA